MGRRVIPVLAFLCALSTAATAATAAAPNPVDAHIAAAKASMMTSPQGAFDEAAAAEQAAALLPPGPAIDIARATAGWLKGEALIRLNRSTDAIPFTEASLKLAERAAPGTKLVADLYRSRGNLNASLGRVELAFRDFQRAHDLYRRSNEPRGEAMALQDIGSIYSDAGDDERVLYYYAQSAETFSGDPVLTLSAFNNRAGALKKLGRLAEAMAQYRAALSIARTLGGLPLQVRILANLADAQVLAGELDAAERTAEHGLAIATGEAAEARPFLLGVRARVEFLRGSTSLAASLIERTFAGQDLTRTPVDFRDFHKAAYEIYHKLGNSDRALAHLEAFKRLDDQTRALTASTSAALVAANFDFANQNLRIAKLKAGEIARDATIAQSRARLNAIILLSVLAVGAVALVLLSIGFVQSRRSRDTVRAANQRLAATNTALEAALTAKTQFLATTSHEIRTPLNGILGMTEVILSDRALAPSLRDRLEIVHGAGKTMRALVDDILDVAKMEHGEISLSPTAFALPALLDTVARLWEIQARAKGVELVMELEHCPGTVFEDEGRLRQIVFNLLSNAVKFTDSGTVQIVAEATDEAAPRLRIAVTDSGVGIPAGQLDHIFESFQQVDGRTTRRFGGTGLGLAIVRNLARAMGGDVTVTSTLGKGSCFELLLPLHAACGATGSPAPCADGPRQGLDRARLLIVERNPLSQSILTAIIGPRVDTIVFASSATEARSAAMSDFEHVVVDLASIEDDDAIGVLEHLRQEVPTANLILLAPELDEECQARLARAGADTVLVKPVTPRDILAAITQPREGQPNLHSAGVEQSRAAA